MHRANLIQQLEDYDSRWPAEKAAIGQFLEFVKAHADCFERSLRVGHVTGSAWVVNEAGTHVLLTHHRKLDRWLQLGGHSDGDSDTVAVAMREIAEESGLVNIELLGKGIFDIDIHEIPARGDEPAHFHHDVRYAFKAFWGEAYTVSDESHDLSWVEIEKLADYTTEESMVRMAQKWKALKQ